eukprot:8620870-Pyramimonas_sp.AAC.1
MRRRRRRRKLQISIRVPLLDPSWGHLGGLLRLPGRLEGRLAVIFCVTWVVFDALQAGTPTGPVPASLVRCCMNAGTVGMSAGTVCVCVTSGMPSRDNSAVD